MTHKYIIKNHFYFYRLILFSCFVLLSTGKAICQSYPFAIRHYTSENGLPQNSVLHILFDKNGYCWISTEAGLVRFDNSEFKVYGTDNIQGVNGERFRALGIDTLGNVFAKNTNGQTISTISNDERSPVPYLSNEYDSVYFPTTGYLNGLMSVKKLWDSLAEEIQIPIVCTHVGLKNGDDYLLSGRWTYFITNKNVEFIKQWSTSPKFYGLLGDTFLIQIWKNNKIALWQNGKLLPVTKISGTVPKEIVELKDSAQLFWCPTGTFIYLNKSIYQFSINDGNVYIRKVLQNLPPDIDMPSCLYFSAADNTFYIGTLTKGLYIIKISDFYSPDIPKNHAIHMQNVYAVEKSSKDEIIAKGVVIPRHRPSFYTPFSTTQVYTAFVDSSDVYYFQNGFTFAKFDMVKNIYRELLPLNELIISILPNNDSKGLILCSNRTIFSVSKNGNIYWEKKFPLRDKNEVVNYVYPLMDNKYLLLTNRGIKWYDFKTNCIYKSILDTINFVVAYKDEAGRLWFGSDGNGSYMYQNNEVYKLPLGNLNSLKKIHAFIDDGNGYFWLPTNNGIFRVKIDSLVNYITHKNESINFNIFTAWDGLKISEFNRGNPSFQWLRDSTLIIPSMSGLVEFKPNKIHFNQPDSKIFLDELRVDSEDILSSKSNNNIKLNPDFNLLILKISCPYFGNPRNLQLEYSIRKTNEQYQWQKVQSSGVITINTLSAGNYDIIVHKAGYNLNDKNATLILKLQVLPYFYNTLGFYLLIIALVIIMAYLVQRNRVQRLEKENKKIEETVLRRTDELNKTTQQLRISESELRQSNLVKDQIVTMVLHDLRSPIRFLKIMSDSVINVFKAGNSDNLLNNLRKLDASVSSLWEFTDQFLSWAVSQRHYFKIEKKSFQLQEVFDMVTSAYSDIVSLNENVLEIVNTSINCITDKDVLFLIIRNMVDNANKNTHGGCIFIEASEDQSHIYISIKDQGKGISDEKSQMFKNKERNINKNGIGSLVIINMLDKIEASLSVKSVPDSGTEFTIEIKKENN